MGGIASFPPACPCQGERGGACGGVCGFSLAPVPHAGLFDAIQRHYHDMHRVGALLRQVLLPLCPHLPEALSARTEAVSAAVRKKNVRGRRPTDIHGNYTAFSISSHAICGRWERSCRRRARGGAFSACSPPAFLLLHVEALTACLRKASLHKHARLSGLVAHAAATEEEEEEMARVLPWEQAIPCCCFHLMIRTALTLL